jgi:crotonobetainyl-CoA:carnitine CoA-transferase CaiB-like acyl-CoA transferase
MGPLDGLRVLEIGDRGEVAGKILADAGADVIRVEPPAGAASRHAGPFVDDRPDVNGGLSYAYWNTSKRGVTLDIEAPGALPLWRALVERSEVVIDGGPPGHLDGRGGYAEVGRDGLIWCSVTPFGLEGPWRDFAANDLVSMALGGPMMFNGYDDHDLPPIRPDGNHSLTLAGQYAAVAILAALHLRDNGGPGGEIDLSVHEAVSGTIEGGFPNWEYYGRGVQRQTSRQATMTGPTLPWQLRCADGRYIVLMGGGMPRDQRTWDALMEWMEPTGLNAEFKHLRFSRDEIAGELRDRFLAALHAFIRSMPAEEAYRGGQSRHLPFGIVRRPEENLDDPHWHDRGFFVEAEVAGYDRPVRYPGAPYKFSLTPVAMSGRAPLLGEHNSAVYGGLGYSRDQLVALAKAGVI